MGSRRSDAARVATPAFVLASLWLWVNAVSVVLPFRWGPGHVFAVFGGCGVLAGAALATAGTVATRRDLDAAVYLGVAGLLLGAAGLGLGGYYVTAVVSFCLTIPVAALGVWAGPRPEASDRPRPQPATRPAPYARGHSDGPRAGPDAAHATTGRGRRKGVRNGTERNGSGGGGRRAFNVGRGRQPGPPAPPQDRTWSWRAHADLTVRFLSPNAPTGRRQ